MPKLYGHFRDVPASAWRWPHFSPAEIASRDTGELLVNEEALDALERLRTALGRPMIVNSAYRTAAHNKAVGGAPHSQHMLGKAFDVSMANHDPAQFVKEARRAGFRGIGLYPRSNFIHVDVGPERSWGEPFPTRETRFAPDAAPAREELAGSRTLQGAAVATAGTVGASGLSAVIDALAEAKHGIEPLVPTLEVLRWLLVAITLAGVALTVYARLDDWRRGRR